MSIAQNQGGIYKNLDILRKTNGKCENNFFKTMGFDYLYVEEGNNIDVLVEAFKKVKDINHPIVVHLHTKKGLGYQPAVENKEFHHWMLKGFLDKKEESFNTKETYESITIDYILDKKEKNEPIVAITAATPGVFGFNQDFRNKMRENYVDVAISEEHAVAFASGLAKNGAKPILCFTSSFVQRTYDQLSQDLALNNSPATILIYWGGISPMDMTHLGVFDIPLIMNIPNIVYLAPTNKEEYLAMLDWSYKQNEHSTIIRVPFVPLESSGIKDETDYSILNKYQVVSKGEKVAILGLGNFFNLAKEAKLELEKCDINATLINPKYITGMDCELLEELKEKHQVIITLEDGVLDGGWGEKISRFYADSDVKVLNYGAKKEFTDRISTEALYEKYRLKSEFIVKDVLRIIK